MWIAFLVMALAILALLGGVLLGGVFTIVLIPLAALAVVSAILASVWGRASQGTGPDSGEAAKPAERPLPHSRQRGSGHAPTSPERLVDVRRTQQ